MRLSIACLVVAYLLSQFYRTCLAVLTPVLHDRIGVTAGDLAVLLGLWYAAFALVQIPVGEALDRIGPRRTVGWTLALGGGDVICLAPGIRRGPRAFRAANRLWAAICVFLGAAGGGIGFLRFHPRHWRWSDLEPPHDRD